MLLPVVELPWPSPALHPNARGHWGKKASATKKARRDAAVLAMAAGLRGLVSEDLTVTAIFFPPDNRHRDLDGMLSSLKPAFDGIADVIGVDDSQWKIELRKGQPRPLGAVRIEIEVPS